MTLLFISFIAGVLTVLAPCVLPLLPVIVGGSVAEGGNKYKSYTIIGSLIISIVVFTLVLKWSTAFVHVPPMLWSYISGGILILVSLSMIFPDAWDRLPFVSKLSIGSNKVMGAGYQKKSFWGDVIVGAALGPVFSSCSPTYFVILATVLPASFARGILDLFAYSIGLGLVLLLIAFLGQKIVDRLGGVSDPKGWFKRTLGVLFLLVGIFVFTGLDKRVETTLISKGFVGLETFEEKLLSFNTKTTSAPVATQAQTDLLNQLYTPTLNTPAATTTTTATTKTTTSTTGTTIKNTPEDAVSIAAIQAVKSKLYPQYHDIVDPGGFVNTGGAPIKIGDYIGKKVVMVDFMTYSCINCQRTFPYDVKWYTEYEDKGLIIIGIHTPEFAFEHDINNVTKAMQSFGIKFPVVLDNDYGTWNAYGNEYWPRKYLIDIDGYVVYDKIGEGDYDKTEQKIVDLLNERAKRLGLASVTKGNIPVVAETSTNSLDNPQSPETYLGTERSQYEYKGTGQLPINSFSLSGSWDRQPQYVQLTSSTGSITYHFNAKEVHLVAEGATGTVSADIYLDGALITSENSGADVTNGTVNFSTARLYTLVNLKNGPSEHTVEIRVKSSGLQAYAFTFS